MNQVRRKILITGGNFTNQGAYLMLCAAAQQIRDRLDAQPVIAVQTGSEREKRWIGLDSLMSAPRFRVDVWGGRRESLRKVKNRLPVVFGSDIDAVFDISGFVFSDEWLHLDLARRARELARWPDRGVPLFVLPQAFGPFDRTAEAAAVVLDAASIVFAREQDSFDYLKTVQSSSGAQLLIAPDFTGGLPTEAPAGAADLIGAVPIVPNWNISERAESARERTAYIDNLVASVRYLDSMGLRPYGLCHEGGKDREVLTRVQEALPNFRVVDGLTGTQSRWLLGRANFVISGRFHALVSALSQGVPAVVHGWSHKYEWLATDYAVPELRSDPYGPTDQLLALLYRIVVERELFEAAIVNAGAEVEKRTAQMWDVLAAELGWNDER